ncbi:MAG: GNAT family N-acetyltransferase [Prevotellaceae bacterium]|jgi:GNAT superfamily N-acetyltransferase|nr:GNAT family N-acetyltransferase [Prevotellaceae bacterium]
MNLRNLLTATNSRLIRLEEDTLIKPFESEDNELNDFLHNDARNYLTTLLAATYLIQTNDETLAYFSLSNDSLIRSDMESAIWNRINRAIPNEKRRRTYPAVKIGRLAVAKKYAGMGFGKLILLTVREMYVTGQQRSGCRFIMVDAYRNAFLFYEKNGFRFLTQTDVDDETRIMYFDLKAV